MAKRPKSLKKVSLKPLVGRIRRSENAIASLRNKLDLELRKLRQLEREFPCGGLFVYVEKRDKE
jgi:hypothetical protein